MSGTGSLTVNTAAGAGPNMSGPAGALHVAVRLPG